jgi:DNA-binding protein HU-beta
MPKITKVQMIAKIAHDADISLEDARRALDVFMKVVEVELQNGGDINIGRFGKFDTRTIPERSGINPASKTPLVLPARKVPMFKAWKPLKEAVK